MRVQDVMTPNVKTIAAAAPADEAWNAMRAGRFHHLVVTDGRAIVGVLSDRDIGGRNGGTVRASHTVGDLMSTHVVTVPPDATIRKAANLMRGRSTGSVVVAKGPRPIGILTTADLLDLLGRGVERTVEAARRHTLSHKVPHSKRHQSAGAW